METRVRFVCEEVLGLYKTRSEGYRSSFLAGFGRQTLSSNEGFKMTD